HWLFEAIEPQFDFGGSRTASLAQLSAEEAGSRMYTYGQELIASKRAAPTDDMLSVVANAKPDDLGGEAAPAMSDLELYLFFSLLFSAGAETTRNAVGGGLLALADHPEQLRTLREDLGELPTAVEEMVRWASPSPSKRRTATRPVTLGGQSIEAGQKVQIWEGSANRDASVFDRADEFDITRKPNPHLGFGQGVHYCLGANLARLELRVLFEELLSRFRAVRVVQDVEWTRSNRHTGIRHLVVELR
ncbi:MAG TPA: cytochrome P450, partial [Mycobacterium sp.]